MTKFANAFYRDSVWELILISALLYLFYQVFLNFGLRLEMMVSDVAIYWKDSFDWATPFSKWWVPGYSLMIALVRAITFNLLPPLAVMSLITGAFYLISVVAAYMLAVEFKIASPLKVALLYAVFPFVGLTYAVYPIADSMASALLLLSLLSFARKQWLALTVYAGLAMVTHKALWFFIPPLLLIGFIKHRESRLLLPFAFAPLAILLIAGAIYHNDIFWMVRWGVENLIVSKSSFPVFDGILGSLFSGSIPKIAKGALAFLIILLTITALYLSWRHRFLIGLPVSLALVLMALTINQYEVWAVVRFSKVLIIPLSYFALQNAVRLRLPRMAAQLSFPLLFLIGIITNVMFGYYMARMWTAP